MDVGGLAVRWGEQEEGWREYHGYNVKWKRRIKEIQKNFLIQNIKEIWDTIRRANLIIIGTEKEESLLRRTENIFWKIIEENFPSWTKNMPIKVQEVYQTPNRLEQKIKSPWHRIIKNLSIQNKEKLLKLQGKRPSKL